MKLPLFFIVLISFSLFINGENGCGSTWNDANTHCKNRGCSTNGDCAAGEYCYASIAGCDGSAPTTPSAPSTPSNSGSSTGIPCTGSHTVTNSDLQRIMESNSDFSRFVDPINTALKRYDMTCPQRIASFLSQVRHETAGLTVFFQPIDSGAGTLHMIPGNWGFACAAIPELKSAFANAGCGSNCDCIPGLAADPLGATTQNYARSIFSDPLVAFLTGCWWFKEGAATPAIFGFKGCGDLRYNCDEGLGAAGPSDCHHTGIYQVTCCVFWTIGGSSGLTQRIAYYNTALNVATSWGSSNAAGDSSSSIQSSDNKNVVILGAVCGVGALIIVVLIAIIVVMSRRMSRVESV